MEPVTKENHFTLWLHVDVRVKQSIVIGSCVMGSKTPLQLTMLNVMGTLCDLFYVSMDIYHSKFNEGNLGHTTTFHSFTWEKGNLPLTVKVSGTCSCTYCDDILLESPLRT